MKNCEGHSYREGQTLAEGTCGFVEGREASLLSPSCLHEGWRKLMFAAESDAHER